MLPPIVHLVLMTVANARPAARCGWVWGLALSWLALAGNPAWASGWSTVATPNPPHALRGALSAVSCSSPRACTAVGSFLSTTSGGPLAERWNGSHWTLQQTATLGGRDGAALLAVSCPRVDVCVAVGTAASHPLVARWSGGHWRAQRLAAVPQGSLSAVSCAAPKACTAVGTYANSTPPFAQHTLAERWNGVAWRRQVTPDPAGAQNSGLDGIACRGRSVCEAVGSAITPANPFGIIRTLAERWNGRTWRIQVTPNPAGAQDAVMTGVSCPTITACAAVGDARSEVPGGAPLAERWRLNAWVIQPTQNPLPIAGAVDNALMAISCASPRACTAVGNSTNPRAPLLAERFNGAVWQRQPIFLKSRAPSYLTGVSCPSVRLCIAVGGSGFRTVGEPLAERWTG